MNENKHIQAKKSPELHDVRIALIGLGYVGLPLAVEFGRHYPTVGFDISATRIEELRQGKDATREVTLDELGQAEHLHYTNDPQALRDCNVFIVTVPTPIDRYKRPDLSPLMRASETVGRILKSGDIVIYESTVYPGCTEEVCVPILERESGLRYETEDHRPLSRDGIPPDDLKEDASGYFFVGYSPERINPGDRKHRLPSIVKVTSGSTSDAARFVDDLYKSIIVAGTHKASSIRVAEAAKVIENTQRDVNIALINELAMLFHHLGIDTDAVLAAAGSKWNFLPFRPGLVGGHCIGVDPYYLTHKAQETGFHPAMILAGRRINDGMSAYVAQQVVKLMAKRGMALRGARILILGLTFKENCPDLRNTRVIEIIDELKGYGAEVDVYDPWVEVAEARSEYGIDIVESPGQGVYDAIILAVAHKQFAEAGIDLLRGYAHSDAVLYDVKHLFPAHEVDGRL
jgi:UDP-N-acetyl-D-glucosamine/UDP-N-acetyl-D-galactosamine dehydrogenase